MIISRANRFTSTLRTSLSQCFSFRSCSLAVGSRSAFGFIAKLASRIEIELQKLIHLSTHNPHCSDSSQTRCGSMSCTRERLSLSPGRARVCPTGWIVIFGTVWCAASARSANCLEYLQRIWTSAALTPEWMKRPSALAVWAVCCPARTLDKFKFILASSLLGCWRCFFCTHGWFSHGDYFDSADRRTGCVYLAPRLRRGCGGQASEWSSDCAHVLCHFCRLGPGVVGEI